MLWSRMMVRKVLIGVLVALVFLGPGIALAAIAVLVSPEFGTVVAGIV